MGLSLFFDMILDNGILYLFYCFYGLFKGILLSDGFSIDYVEKF